MATITDRTRQTLGDLTSQRRRRWLELASRYEGFCRTHGRIPSHRASDPQERSLAMWLANSRHRRSRLDDACRERFGEVLVVHEATVADRMDTDWRAMALRVIDFCDTRDHPPRVDAADLTEHRLARWAESYRHRMRTRQVTASVVARRQPLWDRVERAWRQARDIRFGRFG